MKFYAGIGSRETPDNILQLMTLLAQRLEKEGWILRSGGATGADSAFEEGVQNPENKEIYLPGNYFNGRSSCSTGIIDSTKLPHFKEALATVDEFHPAPQCLKDYGRKLMARNAMQVLGSNLRRPSLVVIAWTKNGLLKGGTSQAIRIANSRSIPVINLGLQSHYYRILNPNQPLLESFINLS